MTVSIPSRSVLTRATWVTDAFLTTAVVLIGATALGSAYGGLAWLWTAATGVVAGLAVAGLSRRFRLGPWLTALAAALVYLVVGSVVAVPDHATQGFLPSLDSLRSLAVGLVTAWRDSLTLLTPLGSTDTVLIVPFVIALLAGLGAGLLLWRGRPAWSLLPLVGSFIAAAAFGEQMTTNCIARGTVLVFVLLIWLRWRALRHHRVRWVRRIGLTGAMVAVAAAIGLGAAQLTAPSGARQVLRDHVEPPFDPQDYKSPLSRFRSYKKDLKTATLFTVTGLPEGQFVRLATMDTFDGVVWNVSGGPNAPEGSGTFKRVRADGQDGAQTQRVTITIEDYRGIWVPSVGRAVSAHVDGGSGSSSGTLLNTATGTIAQVGGVQEGDTVVIDTVTTPMIDAAQLSGQSAASDVTTTPPISPPDRLVTTTAHWANDAGASSAGAQTLALIKAFRQGYYSDGQQGEYPSASGHGSKRLAVLFTGKMVGDAEQYASAMGVALQSLGVPTRVVLGFQVPADGRVTGDDVVAWNQVKLADSGWVDIFPTPDKDRTLKQQTQDPVQLPQPQVLPPPDTPQDESDDTDNLPYGSGVKSADLPWAGWGLILKALKYGGGGALLLAPIWLVLLTKALRRRRRRRHADPVTRLSGGWRELTDTARDLGTTIPTSHTRYETSVALAERYPAAGVPELAQRADERIFGPGTPSAEEVSAYWADVATARKRMAKATPWWRRRLAAVWMSSLQPRRRTVEAVRRTRAALKHLSSRLTPRTRRRRSTKSGGPR